MKIWDRVFINKVKTFGLLSWPLFKDLDDFRIAETRSTDFGIGPHKNASSGLISTKQQYSFYTLAPLHFLIFLILEWGSAHDSNLDDRVNLLYFIPKLLRCLEGKDDIFYFKLADIILIFFRLNISVNPIVSILRYITIWKIIQFRIADVKWLFNDLIAHKIIPYVL